MFVKNLTQLEAETEHLVKSDLLGVGEDGYLPDSDYKFNQMVSLDRDYTIVGIKHEKRGKAKKAAR